MISCVNLTRYFSQFVAVDRLSFELPQGSVLALVGENGAGKSTTMRMLTTLLSPSRGEARVGGYDIVKQTQSVRRVIGYLPETFPLYEDMPVERYLHFFALAYQLDHDTARNRIIDFLDRLGLKHKRHDRIVQLSRGMKQRLGVAKSFLHDPDIVFLDEPASGLDPTARAELRDFLKYQQQLGKTIVVSSHVLKELADFCDHILIMSKGRLVEFGPLSGAEGVMAKYSGQAQAGRRFTVRLPKGAAQLEEKLKTWNDCANVTRRDHIVHFEMPGDDEASAAMLTRIVQAGFAVAQFSPEEIDLEAVYRRANQNPVANAQDSPEIPAEPVPAENNVDPPPQTPEGVA